jgi:hypothetical protein
MAGEARFIRSDGSEGRLLQRYRGFHVGQRVFRKIARPGRGNAGMIETIFWEKKLGRPARVLLKIKRDDIARAEYNSPSFWARGDVTQPVTKAPQIQA